MALRHEKRLLQKSEINLGREGTAQAANFPELRSEIVALKKLEQEQKEVALRIARIEEGIKRIEEERQQNSREQSEAIARLESEKKPLLQQRNQAKHNLEVCERELAGVERRIQESEAADRDLLKQLSDLHALNPAPADLEARSASINARRARLPEKRAELVRARLGSADAVRLAKEKLNAVGLDVVEAGSVGVLSAPQNIRAAIGKLNGTVIVRWDSVTGRDFFSLECATDGAGPWVEVYKGKAASATCSRCTSLPR